MNSPKIQPITPENPVGNPQHLPGDLTLRQFLMAIPFVIILIFMLFAVKNNNRTNPVVIPSPTPAVVDDFLGWKTWSDELDTYLIQAPADWELITHSSNFLDMHFITLKASDGSIFQSSATETDLPTLTEYLQDRDQKNATGWEGQPSKKIISSKRVTVGNSPAIERVEVWLAAGYTALVTYLKADNYLYEFSIQPSEIEYPQSEVFKNYHQILSSFKLQTFKVTTSPSPKINVDLGCKVGGCSSELCLDANSDDIASICIWKDEYACYQYSVCEKQSTGQCAWTQTTEYQSCLKNLVN